MARPQRVLPPEARKAIEIGVGGHQCAPMLDGHSRVLRVCRELPGRRGLPAEFLEDSEVIRAGTDDASLRPPPKLANEVEGLFKRRWRSKDAWVGYDPYQTSESQDGESERFTAGSQIGQPSGVTRMVRRRVLAMSVDEDVYVWK